jgi:hypothetical protein
MGAEKEKKKQRKRKEMLRVRPSESLIWVAERQGRNNFPRGARFALLLPPNQKKLNKFFEFRSMRRSRPRFWN